MIRPATPADLPEITRLLARANATPYDITRVAEEKVFGRGYGGEAQPRVHIDDDAITGIAVTCGNALRLIAVHPAHRRRGIGTHLLGDAQIAFAEAGNYFTPGVIESDTATRAFFASRGFTEQRWTHNLSAPLRATPATQQLSNSATPERATTRAAQQRVLDFVARVFSPIWRFEAERAPHNLFYIEHEGEIAGFSTHDANNRTLGTFGPTGVNPRFRGRGYGTVLLRASLDDLARAGYQSVIIPWTDALEFYRRGCGAEVEARFVTLVR